MNRIIFTVETLNGFLVSWAAVRLPRPINGGAMICTRNDYNSLPNDSGCSLIFTSLVYIFLVLTFLLIAVSGVSRVMLWIPLFFHLFLFFSIVTSALPLDSDDPESLPVMACIGLVFSVYVTQICPSLAKMTFFALLKTIKIFEIEPDPKIDCRRLD